jgi:hypothetical protein
LFFSSFEAIDLENINLVPKSVRTKKQRIEELILSQKGAMDRFIIKESQMSSSNQTLDQDPALDSNIENDPRDHA